MFSQAVPGFTTACYAHPMPALRLAFLGCGFITGVHSQHLKSLRRDLVSRCASRDLAKAEAYCRRFQREASYAAYEAAINDTRVDAVVAAGRRLLFHRTLAEHALFPVCGTRVSEPTACIDRARS